MATCWLFLEPAAKLEMVHARKTPVWVQNIAFEVKDRDTLIQFKGHLEAKGVEVLGVTDHSNFHSIYFFDPNGHRMELACPGLQEEALPQKPGSVKWEMLNEWSETDKAPKHADWLYFKKLNKA